MKKKSKIFSVLVALFIVATSLSSCTKSFCSVRDKASMLAALDVVEEGKVTQTETINEGAKQEGYLLPSDEFLAAWEVKINDYANALIESSSKLSSSNEQDVAYAKAIAKFAGNYTIGANLTEIDFSKDKLWQNYDAWMKEITYEVGIDKSPDQNYIDYYKKQFELKINGKQTCISPTDAYISGINLEGKSWKEAFNIGLIEGLLVYPVSWLIYTFSNAFGGNGWGQLLAILMVTLIVRAILILCTFRSTLSQQRMTALQPELEKISAKYPNAATNPYEKQRMGQEQMALYKKYHINPFSMIIVMLFQFPIFIAVWSAMTGSAVLMDGVLFANQKFALSLAANTGSALGKFNWVAILLFIVMSVLQFLSMKIPQWLQKRRTKNVAKLQKNPTQDKNQRTMNMVSYMMVIMIIFMGLQLPIAMTFYWTVTALIGIAQSVITQAIVAKNSNKKEKKKTVKYVKK